MLLVPVILHDSETLDSCVVLFSIPVTVQSRTVISAEKITRYQYRSILGWKGLFLCEWRLLICGPIVVYGVAVIDAGNILGVVVEVVTNIGCSAACTKAEGSNDCC